MVKDNTSNSLEHIIQAEGVIAISDTHGKVEPVTTALSYAEQNSLALAYNGDYVNDYHFTQYAQDLGLEFVDTMRMSHYQQHLNQKDLQAYSLYRTLSQVSLEELLHHQEDTNQKEYVKELASYINQKEFSEKLTKVEKDFQNQNKEKIVDNTLKLRALYEIVVDEQAKEFAQELNKYSNVQVLYNLGNHENVFFVEQVRQYLENKDQIVDVTNTQGHIELSQSNGEHLTLGGMTNCLHSMPYLQEIYGPEELSYLLQHMYPSSQVQQELLAQGKYSGNLSSLEEKIKQDEEFQRITARGVEDLDIFLSHGQIGKVEMESREGFDVPYSLTAAYLSSKSQLTLEGHIHDNYSGINSFGTPMKRAAGNQAVVVSKQSDGSLETQDIVVDDTFDGNHKNPLHLSQEYLLLRIEEVTQQYKQALANQEKSA